MKIAIINNLYKPYNRGGTEVVVEKQVKELQDQGHEVLVISTKPLFDKKLKEKGIYRFYPVNIFSVYNINKFPIWLRAIWRMVDIFNWHSYFKIKSILQKEKPSLVCTHNLTGIGYLIPGLLRKLKIKNIQIMHDVALVRPSGLLIYGQEKKILGIILYAMLTRILFGSPDEVIFPSEWLKNFYEQQGFFKKSKKIVKYNFEIKGDDLIKDNPPSLPLRRGKGNKLRLLYVGQIERHKGIIWLVKIIIESGIKNPVFAKASAGKYELKIIGSGSKEKELKKIIKENDNIKWLGWKNLEELKQYFEWADYTVVPSLCYENSPTVIFESLKNNTPVIASNLGGIPELIEEGKNGYLFVAGNKAELTDILKSIIIKGGG